MYNRDLVSVSMRGRRASGRLRYNASVGSAGGVGARKGENNGPTGSSEPVGAELGHPRPTSFSSIPERLLR